MSHFTTLVVLPEHPRDLMATLAEVLAPYDESLEVEPYIDDDEPTTYNPKSKWDWWVVGGRWDGYFPAIDAKRFERLANAQPSGLIPAKEVGRYNGGLKGLLDLGALRRNAAEKAEHDWNTYSMVVLGTPSFVPWSHFVERAQASEKVAEGVLGGTWKELVDKAYANVRAEHGWPDSEDFDRFIYSTQLPDEFSPQRQRYEVYKADIEDQLNLLRQAFKDAEPYTMEDARRDYHAQPRIAALRAHEAYKGWMLGGPEEEFERYTREEYIARKAAGAVPTYSMIDLKGEWHAPGEMGWWGLSTDNHDSQDAYHAQVNEYVDALPDDAFLVVLDLHI